MAASRAAAARTATRLPPPTYGLEVDRPGSAADAARIPWIEVSGRVGSAELFEADLVIALDLSVSAMMPSGMDLDEDGVIGEVRGIVGRADVRAVSGDSRTSGIPIVGTGSNTELPPPRLWTTDADDTLVEAELGATRAILHNLALRRNRYGVVTYADRARLRAPLGSPEAALDSLERIRMPSRLVPTSVARGLRQARLLLTRSSTDGQRQRAVLLFTDGRPTDPDPYLARLLALYEARALLAADIDLYLFATGPVPPDAASFLIDLARETSGRVFRVGAPERLFEDPSPVELVPRQMQIDNATTGAEARGVRTALNGRFDAFVPLEPGVNKIRIFTELGDGKVARWERDVYYEPPEVESDEHRSAEARVLRELERRADDATAVSAEPL